MPTGTFLKPSSEINITEQINQEIPSPSKSLPLRSVDTVTQQDNYRKISNISTASTDSAYTSDTNMTYNKQLTDINQVPSMVEVVPENYVPNGNDNNYHQDSTVYQNVEPSINQDASTFIPNTMTQWNYPMNIVQSQPSTTVNEELQRKISTVSTVSNLSSLSSDSVQGLVQHAIIHEENANNQNMYVQNLEGKNVIQSESLNYCNAQSPSTDTYLPSVPVYPMMVPYQENPACLNYNNKVPEEINMVDDKPVDIVEPIANIAESDIKQNLR